MLQIDDDVEVTVYLTADAVLCARTGQQTPEGYYNIERMLKPIIRRGTVMTCEMCMAARGLREEDLVDGVLQTRLGELAQLVFEADRILVY
jgi:uncharacterized protein involved in oxidation of intracellular sulfur